MSPANDNAQLMSNYSGLQASKMNELRSLIDHAEAPETAGHSGALLPLSKIVRERSQRSETIVTLEQLERGAVEWYRTKGMKPAFECMHVAFVRLQGQEIHVNGEDLGVLLDWVFHGTDVTLILGNGGYVCEQIPMDEMMDLLLPVTGGGNGNGS